MLTGHADRCSLAHRAAANADTEHPTLQGLYFVAASDNDANGWIDALCLAGHLAAAGRLGALRQSLRVAERGPNAAPPSTP